MSKSKSGIIAVVVVFLISLSVSLVAAQYSTLKTTNVTISSNGTFSGSESDIGVSYLIQGTPGATGTVIADVYNGNPQPTATIPSGASLTYFIAITFDMNANDFTQAQITVAYTDSEVQGLSQPYTIYKYMPDTNSYAALPSTVNTAAKTITVTLTSINDPLLALGGGTSSRTGGLGIPSWTWVVVTAVIILVVVFATLIVRRRRTSFIKLA